MDNKNINIANLIRKYEQLRYMNKNYFFDADEFTMIVNHYIKKRDTTEAESAVNIALNMHPHSFGLMMTKAKLLVTQKKFEEAYNYMLTIDDQGTNINLLLLKFECLLKMDKTVEANSFLQYILGGELNDKDHYTFLKRVGTLYNDTENYETAIMLFKEALKIDKTNVEVLIELAFAYEMSEDGIDKAIEVTNAIIDINPYSFNSWVNLGQLYLYNFEYDLSIEAYDFALAIREGNIDVLKLKAITYNEGYDFENEMKVLSECLDVTPTDENLYDEMIQKYKDFEEYWGMEQDEGILKVLEKKEAHFGPKGLLLKMAYHNLQLDRYDKAQEIYARIPDEERYTAEYYKLQGQFALHINDIEGAETAYTKVVQKSPNDVEALDILADIYAESDKLEKAAEYLERLIAIDPEYGIIKFRLAIVRFQIGEKEQLHAILKKITDKEQLGILANMFATYRSTEKRERIDYKQFTHEELIRKIDKASEFYVQLKKERELRND